MFSVVPTEVPPNFKTFIVRIFFTYGHRAYALWVLISLSTFLISPCNTFPGPTSVKEVAPSAIMFFTVWVHLTGAVSCATRFAFDLCRIGRGQGIDILVNGTYRGAEGSSLNGFFQFGPCRFHQGRVEGTTHSQFQCSFGTQPSQFFHCQVDAGNGTGDDDLSG